MNKQKIYAGIGSRETPPETVKLMEQIAGLLSKEWLLRSGGANGADMAFEVGCTGKKEIYLPWKGFNGNKSPLATIPKEAFELAEKYHPAWGRLTDAAKKMMARNSMQVLGEDLKTPADVIICWTKDGGPTGGTGQALRMAIDLRIPIVNLFWFPHIRGPEEIFELIQYAQEDMDSALSMFGIASQQKTEPEVVTQKTESVTTKTDSVKLQEIRGDLWAQHELGAWACVTTNGVRRKDGSAVMGAGIAKDAATRFPDLPAKLGEFLGKFGNRVFLFKEHRIISFPTKNNWKDKSDLDLIRKSCEELMAAADKFDIKRIVIPRPGCSNGGLEWGDVKTAIAPLLDKRVVICDIADPAESLIKQEPKQLEAVVKVPIQTTNDANPEDDGVTHVNVYSKGKTELGRLLTNFADTPFSLGGRTYASVESFWYVIRMMAANAESSNIVFSPDEIDAMASRKGYPAKKWYHECGRGETAAPPTEEHLENAYRAKLAAHPELHKLLKANTLPLSHYYVYGGKKVNADRFMWTVKLWAKLAAE